MVKRTYLPASSFIVPSAWHMRRWWKTVPSSEKKNMKKRKKKTTKTTWRRNDEECHHRPIAPLLHYIKCKVQRRAYLLCSHSHTNVKSGKIPWKFLALLHKAETRANMTHIANSKSERKSLRKTNIYVCVRCNAQNESAVCHSIR